VLRSGNGAAAEVLRAMQSFRGENDMVVGAGTFFSFSRCGAERGNQPG
jgi:hypothetical protein